MTKLRSVVSTVASMICACALVPHLTAQLQATSCATLMQGNQLAEAERCARGILAADHRNALAYEILGAVRLRQKDYATGSQMLREAIRLEPGLVGARLDLANATALEGKYAEADAVLRAAVRLAPNNLDAAFALVRVENAQAHYRQSLLAAQRLLPQLRRREDGLTVLISDALGLKNWTDVAGYLQDWSRLSNPPAADSVVLAELLTSKNDDTDAIQVLASAEVQHAEQFDIHFLLGELYDKSGAPQKATQEYEAGLAIRADCTRCLLELGKLAEGNGQLPQARELLLNARALSPDDVDVLTALGKVSLEMDMQDDAVRSLSTAAKLRPDSDPTQYLLASAYTSNKDYGSSLAILTRLAARHPSDSLFPYSIGAVLYLSGNYPTAETQLRKSLALNPKEIGALYYMGLTLRKQERFAEAEEIFHRLLAEAPQHPAGLTALGELLLMQQRYEMAKAVLEQAVMLDPTSAKAHYILGRTLSRLGMPDASKQEFAVVESLNHRN
jgi:tetratricopeptide (TPR) repeat protein